MFEPLASMPLYVYAMYVYSAYGDPAKHSPNDYEVYRFAETHPSAGKRVQKLRIDECFKVPRIFGFTMPAAVAHPGTADTGRGGRRGPRALRPSNGVPQGHPRHAAHPTGTTAGNLHMPVGT